MIKNSQLPPVGKSYTQIDQIDEVNEGEASAKRFADSFGPAGSILEPSNKNQNEEIAFENPKAIEAVANIEKDEQVKPEDTNMCTS